MITSKLDYCNTACGLPRSQLDKLQRVKTLLQDW